jgi:phosphomannomutase / phosphoglucomutase
VGIYKPCDIRGQAATELTPDLYRRWGLSLGQRVRAMDKFVVGGDVRHSTAEFLAALVEGLNQAGVDVVELGAVPTPIVYYAKRRLEAAGCAIVTASHNRPEVNGLKWMIGRHPPTPDDVHELEAEASNGGPKSPARKATKPRSLDVTFDYVAWLQETWAETPEPPRAVVLDPMHGAWSCRARRYLQAVFPHSLFSAVHDTPNGSFDGRSPDCSRHEHLDELAEAVYRERAYLGVAFDGDGDRAAFVDDRGVTLSSDEAAWVMLHTFDGELAGEKFVYDVKFSDQIPQAARQHGAEPVAAPSGEAFVRTAMLETGARFGMESGGHYYFRELDGGDDGLFAACRLIDHLARSERKLSEIRHDCPEVHITPDLLVPMEADAQQAVLRRIGKLWPKLPQSKVDGIRIDFPEGWGLVRGAEAEPALTFRFEAASPIDLGELVLRFCDALPEFGDALWLRFQQSLGVSDE